MSSPQHQSAASPAAAARADAWTVWRRFLRSSLSTVVLVVLASLLVGYLDGVSKFRQLQIRLDNEVAYAAEVPAYRLQGIVDSLRLLAHQQSMREVLDGGDAGAAARVADLFASLVQGSRHYDQVRWLDEQGLERIRVDLRGDAAVRIPADELQNKGDRYYFREASARPADALYVSPIDLNVEGGQIERPYKPMLRVATPVFASTGTARGIVVINYRAQEIIDRIERLLGNLPGEIHLLNHDGHWLRHPDPAMAWGFMLRNEATLARAQPATWSAMRQAEAGHVRNRDGLWVWRTARIDASIGRMSGAYADTRTLDLIVAMQVPPAQLARLWWVDAPVIGAAAGVFLLIYLALSWRLAWTGHAREVAEARQAVLRSEAAAERALRQSEAERHQAEEALRHEQVRSRNAAELSSREWRRLAESMPQLVWTCDGSGQCDYLSRQWIEYTGMAEAPQLGFGWLEQVHADDRPALTAAWSRAVDSLGTFDVEFRIRRHDGVYRWFKTRAVPVIDDGRIVKWYGSNTDIDDLKHASRALQESERRFRTIYDATPVSIWEEDWSGVIVQLKALRASGVVDFAAYCRDHPEHTQQMLQAVTILDVNQRTLELFRAPDKAAMLRSLQTVFATEDTLPGFIAEVCALAEGKTLFSTQMAVNTVDGQRISVLLAMSFPPPDSSSGIVFVSVIDVTEQRRIADELDLHRHHLEDLVQQRTRELRDANAALARVRDSLLESEARFRSAFESAAIGMALVGLDGRFVQVNRALCELVGYPEAELRGLTFQQLTHPDDLDADLALVRELVERRRRSYQLEKRYLRKDGSVVWIMLTGSTVENAAGELRYFIAQIQDVSESKRAQDALVQREKFLRTITDALPGMVGYWDAQMRCRFANAAYQAWFGRQPEEVVGVDMRTLLGETLFAANEPYIRAALAGQMQRFERTLVRADGSVGHTWAHYIPDIDDGQVRGFFVLVTDVTELKQAQIALQSANAELVERTRQAEAANEAKSRFVAMMSHEIRTPMNAVLGLVQLLAETRLEPGQIDYVRKIHSASRALLKILNDILDYSKIEAGHMALETIEFTLDSMLESVGDLFAVAAEEKGLELFVRLGPNVPQRLVGDPMRLGQILNNLVGNAIKFTERGEIRIVVECEDCGSDALRLQFRVEDTGIGIPAQQLENLFQPFVQGDDSTTRRFGGTGLGLAICRRLVEMMRGRIAVSSVPGRGTCVEFSVCLDRASAALGARAGAGLHGLRVLVVDDRQTSREILESMMTGWGITVATAGSAMEAAAAIAGALRQGQHFDVMLFDAGLSDPAGDQTPARLVAASARDGAAPCSLVLMSADSGVDADVGLPAAGAVLLKPVTPSRLLDLLAGILGHERISPATGRRASVRECRERLAGIAGARILVVEDNPINREVARDLLTQLGLHVDLAVDGAEALRRAAAVPYDLILMDLQMPVMDGFEATRRLRAHPGHAVPVVAMTAAAMAEDRAAARQAGMDDYLSKPIDLDELAAVLSRYIAPRGGAVAASSAAGDASALAPMPRIEGIDAPGALARLSGNHELFQRLLRQFADQARDAGAQLRKLADADDRPGLARTLHSLKGAAATVGADRIAVLLADMEAGLHAARRVDPAPLETALADLLRDIDRLPATPGVAPGSLAPLREQLARVRTQIQGHRAIASVDIDALLGALRRHGWPEEGQRLAHALEEFDYTRAREQLALIEERLS